MTIKRPPQDLTVLRRKAEEAAAGIPDLIPESETPPRLLPLGAHARHRAGTGEKFWQYRDYDPADRPQDIDWRQSAKGERVFVRQKEHQAPRAIYLWCGGGARMAWRSRDDLPFKDESAQILCLAAGIVFAHGGERVSVAGADLRPGRGENTLQRIAQELAQGDRSSLPPPSRADMLPAGSYLFAASDFLDPPEICAQALESCAPGPGNALILQILDPAERSFPYDGRMLFRDPGNGESVTVENAQGVRDAYRERIEEHIATLETLCRRRHWHYILHETQDPPERTLARIRMAVGADHFAAESARP